MKGAEGRENVSVQEAGKPAIGPQCRPRRMRHYLNDHSFFRFPPKSYNQDLESAEDRREREAQDLELAKEMAEEDEDMI